MSVSPRTALAWLLSVALMAACSPAFAKGPGGGGGGGSFHGGGSVHSGFSGGNFGHSNLSSGNFGHNWSMGTPHIAARPFPNTMHSTPFVGHGENWNHANWNHENWDHANWNWNHAGVFWNHPRFDWDDWWRFGYVRPWIGIGLGWPGYYDYGYSYPYYGDYYSYDVAPYSVYSPETVETAAPVENETPVLADEGAGDFYPQALQAFQQGDYRNSVRLATHAIVDDPKSQEAHLLLSLGLFAVGQYRGAAMEAHSVAALGAVPDWAKLIALYNNDVGPYTEQLRALEKFVHNNRSAPEGRFLLGFQYMIDGHREVARGQFLQALTLAPRDNMAAQLLTKSGGTIPPDIAKQLESARRQPPATPTKEPGMMK